MLTFTEWLTLKKRVKTYPPADKAIWLNQKPNRVINMPVEPIPMTTKGKLSLLGSKSDVTDSETIKIGRQIALKQFSDLINHNSLYDDKVRDFYKSHADDPEMAQGMDAVIEKFRKILYRT